MKTEKRDAYICDYCGEAFTEKDTCEVHEDACSEKREIVHVSLTFTTKETFTLRVVKGRVWVDPDRVYDDVYGYDDDCDCFVIASEDTSKEHVEELKRKLIEKATEHIKEVRDNSVRRSQKLLKSLENVYERG